ncbi:hypothetical protein RPMA_10995 [Tardiphaga alba]|uniref:Uncharacterized protein n=1 Tax=Tardiphaga alba TaxID=340268 RepID=A0ABX8A778_9BRAD|nr:hypothetical protein RPMA_10995 [Tardiphaga alba]
MVRPTHTSKEVEAAICHAESMGWRFRKMGHWGRLFCEHADRDGCAQQVNGTPRNAENHAKQIRRAVERCPHQRERGQT